MNILYIVYKIIKIVIKIIIDTPPIRVDSGLFFKVMSKKIKFLFLFCSGFFDSDTSHKDLYFSIY